MTKTMGWMGALAALVAAAFVGVALVAQSDLPPYGASHSPPAAVTLFLLLDRVGLPGMLIGAFAHAGLFLVGASHLLRKPDHTDRLGLWPTWVGVLTLGTLSTLPWVAGAGASGIHHQGGWLVLAYGTLGFGTVIALLLWLSTLAKQSRSHREPVRRTSLLLVHFAAHLAALVVLFPCLGQPLHRDAVVDIVNVDRSATTPSPPANPG
ncbi:MAG: hypothetical protein ACOC1F_00515 [Myxococcota bacterium]